MIEIKRVTDPRMIEQIGCDYQVQIQEKDHVIATIEAGRVLHCAVFSYDENEGKIKAISGFGDDLDLLDGLCRAILNIMDINGVKVVYLSEKYEKLGRHVGFKPCEKGFVLELEGFFKCGCCHNS